MNAVATQFPELPTPAAVLERTWRATLFVGESRLDHGIEQHAVYTADQMHQYARDYAAMLAAPAASGAHPDALPDGTLSKSTAKRVEALTQQRGAEWSDDLRAVLDAASEASQVPLMWLANQDFSPEQTKAWLCEAVDATVEEGAFSGSLHQVAEEGTGHVVAFTGCGPKSAANAKFLIWCVHFILKHRDALATTPQPSADAVRELVQRWRDQDARKHSAPGDRSDCADELESLLSAASGEKGVVGA